MIGQLGRVVEVVMRTVAEGLKRDEGGDLQTENIV